MVYARSILEGIALAQVVWRPRFTAQGKQCSFRHKNRDFHFYLADFERLAPETNDKDEDTRAAPVEGMSDKLTRLILQCCFPPTLTNLRGLLPNVDTSQRNVKASLRKIPARYWSTYQIHSGSLDYQDHDDALRSRHPDLLLLSIKPSLWSHTLDGPFEEIQEEYNENKQNAHTSIPKYEGTYLVLLVDQAKTNRV